MTKILSPTLSAKIRIKICKEVTRLIMSPWVFMILLFFMIYDCDMNLHNRL